MSVQSSQRRSAALRAALISLASTLIGTLLVIGIVALFAVWSINRAWKAGLEDSDGLQRLAYQATQTQIDYKIGVQEWKNVLLRGERPRDLAHYRGAFEARQQQVADQLSAMVDAAGRLQLPTDAAQLESLQALHADQLVRYRAALAAGLGAGDRLPLGAATRVDSAVRGIDRELESQIDGMAARIDRLASERRASLAAGLEARYRTLRQWLFILLGGSMALVGASLYAALRTTRDG